MNVRHEDDERAECLSILDDYVSYTPDMLTAAPLTDGNTLGVDSAEIGIFKEGDKVSLHGLLQGSDGGGLEAEIGLEVLSNFANKTLEWQLADQKLGRLLITTDLTKSNSSYDASSV